MVLQNIGGILLVDTAICSIFSPMSVCFNDMHYISTIISINQRLCLHFNGYQSFNDLKDTNRAAHQFLCLKVSKMLILGIK